MRAGWLLALVLLATCEERREVTLVFGGTTGGSRIPIALRCRANSDGRLLAVRGFIPPNRVRLSFVVDFIRLGGLPTCRTSDLVAWCEDHSCAAITEGENARHCVELETTLTVGEDLATAVRDVLARLPGTLITSDGPDEPVLVRIVATAQPCAELAAGTTFDTTQLAGCAASCPVQLDYVDGDVVLDLPTLNDRCEDAVVSCATEAFE